MIYGTTATAPLIRTAKNKHQTVSGMHLLSFLLPINVFKIHNDEAVMSCGNLIPFNDGKYN